MSKSIESLLSLFNFSSNFVEVYDTYTHVSLPPSQYMRKSQVADYFANNKVSNLSCGRSPPAICLHRLPAAGVPSQIAELVRVRNNNVMLLKHLQADTLWLARRVLGQEMFLSSYYCFKLDTYYQEEGTSSTAIGARKLTAEERKMMDEIENTLTVHNYTPAMEILRAHGQFEFLVVPAYTVHAIMLQSDTLMTVEYIVPKGEKGER